MSDSTISIYDFSQRLRCKEPLCSVEEVESILRSQPHLIKYATRGGELPLHHACCNPRIQLDTIRCLIDAYPQALQTRTKAHHDNGYHNGSNNNNNNNNNRIRTPLHEAIIHGGYHNENLDIIKLLVKLKPKDLQVKDFCGYLPLHWALDRSSAQVIEYLLETWPKAAEIEINGGSSTPLHKACSRILPLQLVQKIINVNKGATLMVKDREGKIPLHCAVSMTRGWTQEIPLGLITSLIEKRPEAVTVVDNRGRLPLHTSCCSHAQPEVLQLLVKAFPESVHIMDADGFTPARLACDIWKYVPETVQWLSGGMSPLHVICSNHPSLETIEKVLKTCPDGIRSKKGANGKLPLHSACSAGAEPRIIKFLIKKYPESVTTADEEGCLPLHHASRSGYNWPTFRTIFYKNTVAASIPNSEGDYPLHLACHRSADWHIVVVLFNRHPEALKICNKSGFFPVQLAQMNDAPLDVLYYLIRQLPTSIPRLSREELQVNKGRVVEFEDEQTT